MRVLTFSRFFPAYHPRAGEPTYFVKKILTSLDIKVYDHERVFDPRLALRDFAPKFHTIRAGNRFKAGDWFSPRVWSGKPYRSKQIEIAPPIQVVKTWEFVIENEDLLLNGLSLKYSHGQEIAKNDGLTMDDFLAWFQFPQRFKGQIICWSDSVNY